MGIGGKKKVDVLIVHHYDAHGTGTAAAVGEKLKAQGLAVAFAGRYPDAGPVPQFKEYAARLAEEYDAGRVIVFDIPVNIKDPEGHIEALKKLAEIGPVEMYDHHGVKPEWREKLEAAGVRLVTGDAVDIARALGVESHPLAIVAMVADRAEEAIAKGLVSPEEARGRLLDLAYALDYLVRKPQAAGATDQGELAARLAEEGVALLEKVLAEENPKAQVEAAASKAKVLASAETPSGKAILVDMEQVPPQWQPKAAELLAYKHGADYVVMVAPALDPKTRQQVGWDVRVLQPWTSKAEPQAYDVLKSAGYAKIVGHGKYASVRFEGAEKSYALTVAQGLLERLAQPGKTARKSPAEA